MKLYRSDAHFPYRRYAADAPRYRAPLHRKVRRMMRNAAQMRRELVLVPRSVYTTARSRKPSPFMLRVARASVYYGDSPEDDEAARAAGVPFVRVPRFE